MIPIERGIGSEFWLPSDIFFDENNSTLPSYYPQGELRYVTSGREAITYAIRSVNRGGTNRALLPSYSCDTVIAPFVREGLEIEFYHVNNNLTLDLVDIEKRLRTPADYFLVIHYFGFPHPTHELQEIKTLLGEGCLLEDTTHSVFSRASGRPSGGLGDISISSLRKWFAVPDAAPVIFNNPEIHPENLSSPDNEHQRMFQVRYDAYKIRHQFIETGKIRLREEATRLFGKGEELIDRIHGNPSKISSISENLLQNLDVDALIGRRRSNFQETLNYVNDLSTIQPFFSKLPSSVTPLGFPVISEFRNQLRRYLIENKIYPPVHWELSNEIIVNGFRDAVELSNHILTLPIDQRWATSHMEYIGHMLEQFDKEWKKNNDP